MYNNTTPNYNTQTGAISTGVWAYWNLIWDGSDMYTYKNGAQVGSGTTAANPIRRALRGTNYIGRSNWAADAYLNGAVDELRFKRFYQAGLAYSENNNYTNPQTYWLVGSPQEANYGPRFGFVIFQDPGII